jgi:hypothetical protein
MAGPSARDSLTREEYVVMINTFEEAFLDGVIADYLGTTSMGGAVHIFSSDVDAIRAEIPHFREVVLGLIDRGLIEIRDAPFFDWDAAPVMTREEILATLADPHTWFWTEEGPNRSIMLMTTHHADTLFR